MQILTDLINEITTSLESDGTDAEFIIDKNRQQLLGELLQVAQGFDEQSLTLKAAQKDYERAHKHSGELQSSCDALSRTISEQSETLTNRAKVVEELEKTVEAARFNIEQKEAAMLNTVMGESVNPQQFADALDTYSVAVARISTEDAHPMVVVTLIQMAAHIRNLESMNAVIAWLRVST